MDLFVCIYLLIANQQESHQTGGRGKVSEGHLQKCLKDANLKTSSYIAQIPKHFQNTRLDRKRQDNGSEQMSSRTRRHSDVMLMGVGTIRGVGGVNFEGSGRRWVLSFTGLMKGCRLSVADHPLFILSRSVLTYRWCDERRRLERAAFTRPSRAQTSVCESKLVSCLVVAQMVRGRTRVIRE